MAMDSMDLGGGLPSVESLEGFKQKRAGFVTILGRPNVGKSTLMNHILGMKLAITSKRPQTTRKRMQTVYTSDEGQIVFLDTPGIHKAKNKLGEYMDRAAENTIREVDCVLWLVEPETFIGAGEKYIAELLQKANVPVILAINKIDTVKKAEVLPVIDAYRDLLSFHAIIPISAKHSTGKDELLRELFSLMPYGEPFYDEDTVTDETERNIVSELIREQALRNLSEEVPHGIAVEIESMKLKSVRGADRRDEQENPRAEANSRSKGGSQGSANSRGSGGSANSGSFDGSGGGSKGSASRGRGDSQGKRKGGREKVWYIDATIYCEKNSHKGIIIGKEGAMLKTIGTGARKEAERLLDAKVVLNLWVKVRKDWRDNEKQLRSFGYKEE